MGLLKRAEQAMAKVCLMTLTKSPPHTHDLQAAEEVNRARADMKQMQDMQTVDENLEVIGLLACLSRVVHWTLTAQKGLSQWFHHGAWQVMAVK